MIRFLLSVGVATFVGASAMAGNVIIPLDGTSFPVTKDDLVRIPVQGIAGTKVEVEVTGPAKDTTNDVSNRVKGEMPIGASNKEVDVKPTGKGVVKVKVTVTPPNGKAEVKEYEFEVK